MTGHFFSSTTRKDIVRDALKVLEIKRTTFKRIPYFFIDDNHYLCSFMYSVTERLGSFCLTSNLNPLSANPTK